MTKLEATILRLRIEYFGCNQKRRLGWRPRTAQRHRSTCQQDCYHGSSTCSSITLRDSAVPDSVIAFSSSASTSTTAFDAVHNQWNTTVPVSYGGNVFLAGLSDFLSSALPGGINPVSWTATFYTDTSGVSV